MEKQPFTQAGFAALQQQLYQLDDNSLQLQADQIQENFSGWMDDHFELTEKQLRFLSEINPKAANFLESQTAFAVANRLDIVLSKNQEEDDEDKVGKVIEPKSNFRVTAPDDGSFAVTGELWIEIYYRSS